jgi:pilus assembly protein CpaC
VVEGDEIRIEIRPEVSSLDKVNAIRIQDTVIPAIQTRQSETTVQVRSGQAIVIGGLIQNDVTETLRKFPLLGDIPILGELFKSKKFEHKETELVITVTPTILPEEAE